MRTEDCGATPLFRRVLASAVVLLLALPGCSDDGGATEPDGGRPDGLSVVDGSTDLGVSTAHQQEVDKLVKPILDGSWTMGLVVGLIGPGGKEVYTYGTTAAGGATPDEDTLFEIGSITKTFTSLLLALRVEQGKGTLDQPVQELLPASKVTVPQKNGKQITLRHLSTHVSGLPRMPDNFAPADLDNPYADYDVDRLYAFINSYALTREPGAGWLYSNVGVGLLGHALTLEAGVGYEALVRQRITDVLNMRDTVIEVSSNQDQRLAQGHNDELEAVPHWDLAVLAPAGALRSSARDMLAWVAAQAGLTSSSLDSAMATTHDVHFSHKDLTFAMGLAWLIEEGRYLWHNGGTGGFATFAGFDSKTRTGAVVLANTITAQSPETQLGSILLRMMASESYSPLDLPVTVSLPTATLQRYVGTYAMGAMLTVEIKLQGDALYYVQQGADAELKMYPVAETKFYLRSLYGGGARLSFSSSAPGTWDTLLLEAGQQSYTLTRQ